MDEEFRGMILEHSSSGNFRLHHFQKAVVAPSLLLEFRSRATLLADRQSRLPYEALRRASSFRQDDSSKT